jgi:hypothetical protein
MSDEVKVCNHPLIYEDLLALLAVVRAIPDGIRLATFPSHWKVQSVGAVPEWSLGRGQLE